MFRSVAGEPARDVTAERTGPTRDHGCAPRLPAARPGRTVHRRSHQPPHEEPGSAYGYLGLVALVAERGDQLGADLLVHGRGQVDHAAPAVRVLGCDDPAQTPDERLNRAGHRIRRAGRHSSAGHAPQRRGDVRIVERLDERDVRGGSPGNGGVVRMALLGQRQQ